MDRLPLRSRAVLTLAVLAATVLLTAAPAHAQVAPDERPVIRTQAEIPRHTYPLTVGSASELLTDDQAFADLAERVQADIEAMLAAYVIEDAATLRQFYGALTALAFLRGDHDAALKYSALSRDQHDKPADRLMAGMVLRAMVVAERTAADPEARRAAFRDSYGAEVAGLPWSVVQDAVKSTKGQTEILNRNLLIGIVQSQFDPAVAASGSVGGDVALTIINARLTLDRQLAYFPIVSEVLGEYIALHEVEKEDIWEERGVDLSDATGLQPVVIGIWDTGVDPQVFDERILRGPDGEAVHVAFSPWRGRPVTGPLYSLSDEQAARYPHMRDQMKGIQDIQANIDSPEAAALHEHLATLGPEEVRPFIEELSLFGNFSHGTHVAGIAVEGNPAARLVVVREEFPYSMIPPPLTMDVAERWAANMQQSVDLLSKSGVRVVTMSWGGNPRSAEISYEMNGIGESSEERKHMALEVYRVLLDGMKSAMRSAPEILFIPAAGNSDVDVDFSMFMPAGIALPNVLTVGAVDQAGEETSFTSYGGTVRLHANGFEVESYIPGGERMKFSGTSMSAPNAANLAAKLLAIDPSLSPEQVIELMLEGADRTEDGRRVLMNPRRSIELLSERRGR
jgi:subtilisin family serine protease